MLQKLLKSLFNALPPSAINDGKVWEVTNALNFVVIYHKCHPISPTKQLLVKLVLRSIPTLSNLSTL